MGRSDTDLRSLRRTLHEYPEPAWAEFFTTHLIAERVEEIEGVDLVLGDEAVNPERRTGVPDDEELSKWYTRAMEHGVEPLFLEELEDGLTGGIAVLDKGDGPVIGVRVDIDGLGIAESDDSSHRPTAEGFESKYPGTMHACGHDANIAIGIGILNEVGRSPFEGTLKVFFQPASEVEGGGAAMADTGHVDDVDEFVLLKIGMGFDTGEVVAGASDIYGVQRLRASFKGENAHAGVAPNEGRNAIHAMATATQNLLGIPRHGEGDTRINVGTIEGGEATNLIPGKGTMEIDIRGRDQSLLRYMRNQTDRTLEHSAASHGCSVTTESMGSAPSSSSDTSSRERVENAADTIDGITTVHRSRPLGTGDDGAHLMEAVRDAGGSATYTIVGADLASGHHTDTFDIDEHVLVLATDLLTNFVNLDSARDE